MKISVYAVGDKIEKFYLEAIKEYEKRLSRYCVIKFFHLKNINEVQRKLNPKSFVMAVNTSRNTISSEELADKLDHKASAGVSDISIIVGATPPTYNDIISLSQMEMDFGLQNTILIEQVYRAYRIIHNHPYHK
ncbi:23S rRNA (pseudouridine(1915)-N(3))-methyltransferase RlmH [Bacillus sp. FJAT-26390]|uniref:23S rRNA (pseudouridine(1915)-N(3))-methyltransferase RlmH n=1 Tax=Bacillus sp. FJAT-26390 TaxID=1743142 RepID=UPI000807EE2F|nr:23S rRNA (pseudouridine(1915)-N(3))-methyltransferase RlmH [Bacillus sp. FJAT-26390]OBZ17116.1 50S rRNA methyltransferase [Bacillus sp. FJAT-26390]